MGTGEASGDKRALNAAESAISNPLIDDSSMKGAKGVLISITGGKDLTLFEVDEAATRIREEVDKDANIIVGATFDESLDGIIRVSVVATGIDKVAAAAPAGACCRAAHAAACAGKGRARRRAAVAHSRRMRRARSSRLRPPRWLPPCFRLRPSTTSPSARCRRSPRCSWIRKWMPAGRNTAIIRSRPTCRTPSSRRRPSAFSSARACRGSRTCRCRRSARSCKSVANSDDHQPDQQRKGLFQRIASGLTGRDSEPMHEPAPAIRPIPQGQGYRPLDRSGPAAAACRAPAGEARVDADMPGRGPRRASTRTAGRPLCIIQGRTINSKSRPSCAGRPIKARD